MQIHFNAAEIALKRAHNDFAWLAWHTARLGQANPKKFPKLEKLLVAEAPKKPQTWQEQRNIIRMINTMCGGKDLKRDTTKDH